jgi:hypothetical protein
MIKKILFLSLSALVLFTLALPLKSAMATITLPDDLHPDYAPDIIKSNLKDSENPEKEASNFISYFLQLLAGSLLYLAAPAAVLIIAVAGLRYAASHGDENQMEGAKKTLMYAVIGLLVILLSFAVVKAIITAVTSI